MITAILGGGASGLVAAIAASRNPACQVHIFERQSRVCRKLLATGNGRCNLANTHLTADAFHGTDPTFVLPSLQKFGLHQTLDFFGKLGLLTTTEPSGRVYPRSDQAGSVVDVLRFSLDRPNIHLHTGTEITKIHRDSKGGFLLTGGGDNFSCHKIVAACGGLAGTALGGSMSGYQLLRSLGHHCTKLRPALVQLKSSYPRCASLKGIRAVCNLRLTWDGEVIAQHSGEVQFTAYGLSGPAIFEISRDACSKPGDWVCHLDLLPEIPLELLCRLLSARQRQCPSLTAGNLLAGTVHNRLGQILVQEAGIPPNTPLAQLTSRDLRSAAGAVKDFSMTLTGPMGMDCAQVTAGGVYTAEFDPSTLESRICPGLYACGELLDIDGNCGGYNLQWAWSSGYIAGTEAGKELL